MRKSKYDQSSLSVQDSTIINKDDDISKIENRVEIDTEFVNLMNQIEEIKAIIQELKQIKILADSSKSALDESIQTLNAALKMSDNISNAICQAFVQIENTVVDVKLSETDKFILDEYRHKLIEDEKKLFETQMAELKTIQENHWKEVYKYVKSYSRLSLNGWIAKISVIGFWVLYAYFCLTLGGWVIYSMLL